MEPRARTSGAGLQHFARRGTRYGGAIAIVLGCVAACGADKSTSNNPATTTAPAVETTSSAGNSTSNPPSVPPPGSTPTVPGPTGTPPTTPGDTGGTGPTGDTGPAVDPTSGDTTTAVPPAVTPTAGEPSSEGDGNATGAQSTEPQGTGPQDTGPQDTEPPGPGPKGPSAGCGKTPTLKSGTATIDVDGTAREYILQLPSDYDSSKPYKLIFGLHWRGGQASDVATGGSAGLGNYYGLEALADGSAIFVSPNGLDNGWANTGGRDINFIKAILAAFQADLCIDLDRIFSVGFSYGGMMSFAIACDMGDVFRAVAPLSGALYSGCGNGSAPIALWGSHGTTDEVVPINDGRAGLQEVLDRNHCGTETTPTAPDNCVTYTGCDEGYPVTWCEFNGGHGPQRWQTQPIWEFFSQF